jgi:hypothetical protein
MRVVQSNTATALTVGLAFSPAPDSTSTYQVYDAVGEVTGVHPTSTGHRLAAGAVNAAAVMAIPISFGLDLPKLPAAANDNAVSHLAA